MKGFALLLLCFVAAVQARGVLQDARAQAEPGESPWFVHLRIAVSTSSSLNTCAGALIDNSWILTSKDCVFDARFIWSRYGAVNVYRPELVTEGNAQVVRNHPVENIALIAINRVVHYTDNIKGVPLASSTEEVDSATLCTYGGVDNVPGENLSCNTVALELSDDTYVASSEVLATRFDLGAPLVKDGKLIGVLTAAASEDNSGSFLSVASVLDWIEQQSGVTPA